MHKKNVAKAFRWVCLTPTFLHMPGPNYKIANVGRCSGVGNYITTRSRCEAAAASLNLTGETTPLHAGNNTHYDNPFGCYYKRSASALYWGLAGNTNDDDTDRVSLCIAGSIGKCN